MLQYTVERYKHCTIDLVSTTGKAWYWDMVLQDSVERQEIEMHARVLPTADPQLRDSKRLTFPSRLFRSLNIGHIHKQQVCFRICSKF